MLGKVYNLEIAFDETRVRQSAGNSPRVCDLPAALTEIATATEAVLD